MKEKIKLYRIRSFSLKMNATIDFIRQNLKGLFVPASFITAPVAILVAAIGVFALQKISDGGLENMSPNDGGMMLALGGSYFGFILVMLLISALLYGMVFNYMKLYQNQYPEPIRPSQVIQPSFEVLLKLLLLFIVVSIMVVFGFFFLIIPGIYLAIAVSLAPAIMVFEDKGIIESIQKSFKLISGNWWSTFGLLIVVSIFQSFVATIFIIPFYIFYVLFLFSFMESQNNPEIAVNWSYNIPLALGFGFYIFGTFLTSIILYIGLGFQYFNLVEKKESKGLLQEIDSLEA